MVPHPNPGVAQPPFLKPFAGVGLFTAWEPDLAFQYAGWAKSVAIRPDLCDEATAQGLRQAFRLYIWEDAGNLALEGQAAVDRFQAAGWIGQSEGPDQLAACQAIIPSITAPKALVGVDPYWDSRCVPLLECYGSYVPTDLGEGFPVLGVYDGESFSQYVLSLSQNNHPKDFWIYLAEEIKDNAAAIQAYLA